MDADSRIVRHFRQILLWPLQVMPAVEGQQIQHHWEVLGRGAAGDPWFEVADEITGDPDRFQVRHYNEFVTFLPSVQRFLYGEGGEGGHRPSPIRVLRRADLAQVRLTFKTGHAPVELSIAHVDLHFFYDIDVVVLAVEVFADDIELGVAQELLFRFGRSYPAFWDEEGRGGHCLARVEWLSAGGQVMAASDYEDKAKFLSFVCRNKAAPIAADWDFVLRPMVLHSSGGAGPLRYRQLEYDRMPVMAYLAMDDPTQLSRGDFARLVMCTRAGDPETLPFSRRFLLGFEQDYCYDRFWGVDDPVAADTRFLCSGHAFVVVGDARRPFFTDKERGILGQFRHQYFQLGLIAHFHKASLLMFGDRLGRAVSRLDIRDPESVRIFKRSIRQTFEIFLRFSHRYWFHEVSVQAQAQALFAMWQRHLGSRELYDELRREVQDMAQYLDSDGIRRQANTVVRLTVVTTFGLIGTVTTGFLGMNLFAAADEPASTRLLYFLAVFVPTAVLTVVTVVLSKRLSDVLETLSDERLSLKAKLREAMRLWKAKR